MSIIDIDLHNYKQEFVVQKFNKEHYGEVNTDFILASDILELIPLELFKNKQLKWLDPCAGCGYFTMVLYKKLYKYLPIDDPIEKHTHIVENMLFMIEINSDHISGLKKLFGENANIINADFIDKNIVSDVKFDIIFGNPPFNSMGLMKVPTNQKKNKKQDGKTIWPVFVKKAIHMLNPNGLLNFITPSIWMKKDHKMFSIMTSYTLLKVKTMDNTKTNAIFHGQAQTPTCYFCLKKSENISNTIKIYDAIYEDYIEFKYKIKDTVYSIPLLYPSIFNKLIIFVEKLGSLQMIKTSMRPGYKTLSVSNEKSEKHLFVNISSCKLNKNKPYLVVNYSNIKCSYADKPKLVLAHKMYGFPYYDEEGKYGISNRDNYVLLDKEKNDFLLIKAFLSTNLIIQLMEATRYRMKYLEKYIFEFIPDISTLKSTTPTSQITINNEYLYSLFSLNEKEVDYFNTLNKKHYEAF
mgnify:CR=1 FL=1